MDDFETSASTREIIKDKLRQNFDGKIVRKDLTKKIKEGANVPTYVLEFLLGQYCSSDDDEIIQKGVENVKRILADNYVRPDEAEKVLSKLRQRGAMTIIDQVTVELNLRYDYGFPISDSVEFRLMRSIRKSMTAFSAEVSGVLSNWSTTTNRTRISLLRTRNRKRKTNLSSASGS